MEVVNRAEHVAKAVVEAIIKGARMLYRENQSAGCDDFDLRLQSGETAALEVTTSADESLERRVAAVLIPRKGGPFVPAKRCQNDWLIHPLRYARNNEVRARAYNYLGEVEAAGLHRFFGPTDSQQHPAVAHIYHELAIEAGSVTQWKKPGQIGIFLPGGGGVVTSHHVHEAIRAEAFKYDNTTKLGKVSYTERHFFVYVHPRNYLTWKSLVDEHPPAEAPELPEEVSHVWVVAEARAPNHYVVWRACRGAGWSKPEVLCARTPLT